MVLYHTLEWHNTGSIIIQSNCRSNCNFTMQNTLFQTYKNVAEYFIPIPSESSFYTTGTLTPDEFILTCDSLIQQSSTWQYGSNIPSDRLVSYLPSNKQYIICKNIPSNQRVSIYGKHGMNEVDVEHNNMDGVNDCWLSTHNDSNIKPPNTDTMQIDQAAANNDDDNEIPDMQITNNTTATTNTSNSQLQHLSDSDTPSFITTSTYLTATEPADTVLHRRTYDLSIVYDKYYRTPRLYLFGYNEQHEPLTLEQIMDDVSSDYAYRTVTIETHPYTHIPTVSIHPCKHASVMKIICQQMSDNIGSDGKPIQIDVRNYMSLFLKFIASVLPTIEYDYTQHYQ